MDLIRISDTKLKIMLTSSDMTHYNLHNDNISIADQHVRRVLRKLLEDAKEKTGFVTDMSRLYVQMYPCVDGGCELFISKPDQTEQNCGLPILSPNLQQSRALRASERRGFDMCVYSFLRLEHLIAACKRLDSIGFCGKSQVFSDGNRTYYLVLTEFPAPSLYSPDEYCFLGEYGTRENARALQAYLCEYCNMICKENAVKTLMQL